MKLTLPFLVLLLVSTVVGQETKCPSIEIKGPLSVVLPGEEGKYGLEIDRFSKDLKITWTSSEDKLKVSESGLEASVIWPGQGKTVRVDVRVEGPGDCVTTGSDTG